MPETPDWNAPLPAPAILYAQTTVDAGEAITTVLAPAAVAGRRQVLVGMLLTAGRQDTANEDLRALVQLVVSDNLVAFMAGCAITPEQPTTQVTFPPGTLRTDLGSGMAGQVLTAPGSGTQVVTAALFYYLE